MAPASFLARGASSARTSSIDANPPEAMTGIEMRSASSMVASRLRPFNKPSRAMSVKMIAATPASSKRCAISSAVTSEVSAQPWTATLPSRASRPTATRPGNFFAALFTSSGSRTAAVPMMTRATPLASQASTVSRSRMPPPSCTGMVTDLSIISTACAFIGLPAKAPSRSTTCRYSKPWAAKARACAAGSRLNTVARAMSPCSRRTHWPFFRSMAGNRITLLFLLPPHLRGRVGEGGYLSRLPFQKIRDQSEPETLALFRVKLGADRGVLADDGRDRTAVIGARQHIGLVGRVEVIGMHEIGVTAFRSQRQAFEHRMLPDHIERVPAHMGNFQILLARRNLFDVAGDPVEAVGGDVLLAAGRHQLHADADAEERPRLASHRLRHRLDHAVERVKPSAAIGEGTDARQHNAVGAKHHFGIAGHHNLLRIFHAAAGALERFGGRVQIAG